MTIIINQEIIDLANEFTENSLEETPVSLFASTFISCADSITKDIKIGKITSHDEFMYNNELTDAFNRSYYLKIKNYYELKLFNFYIKKNPELIKNNKIVKKNYFDLEKKYQEYIKIKDEERLPEEEGDDEEYFFELENFNPDFGNRYINPKKQSIYEKYDIDKDISKIDLSLYYRIKLYDKESFSLLSDLLIKGEHYVAGYLFPNTENGIYINAEMRDVSGDEIIEGLQFSYGKRSDGTNTLTTEEKALIVCRHFAFAYIGYHQKEFNRYSLVRAHIDNIISTRYSSDEKKLALDEDSLFKVGTLKAEEVVPFTLKIMDKTSGISTLREQIILLLKTMNPLGDKQFNIIATDYHTMVLVINIKKNGLIKIRFIDPNFEFKHSKLNNYIMFLNQENLRIDDDKFNELEEILEPYFLDVNIAHLLRYTTKLTSGEITKINYNINISKINDYKIVYNILFESGVYYQHSEDSFLLYYSKLIDILLENNFPSKEIIRLLKIDNLTYSYITKWLQFEETKFFESYLQFVLIHNQLKPKQKVEILKINELKNIWENRKYIEFFKLYLKNILNSDALKSEDKINLLNLSTYINICKNMEFFDVYFEIILNTEKLINLEKIQMLKFSLGDLVYEEYVDPEMYSLRNPDSEVKRISEEFIKKLFYHETFSNREIASCIKQNINIDVEMFFYYYKKIFKEDLTFRMNEKTILRISFDKSLTLEKLANKTDIKSIISLEKNGFPP